MNDVWEGSNSDAPLPVSVAPNKLHLFDVIIIMSLCYASIYVLLLQPRCYIYARDSLHVMSTTMTERLSETEKPGSFPGNPSAAVTIWYTRIVSFLLCIYVCVAFNRSTTKEEEEEEEEAVVTL